MLSQAVSIAQEAGAAILAVAGSGEFGTLHKSDASPVTLADKAANAILARELAALDPAIPVISEELPLPPYEERRCWPRYWLVDPLDGTKEFLRGNGQFTVNVALIEANAPVLGVVYVPTSGVCYAAARGAGSRRHDPDGATRAIAVATETSGPLRVVMSNRDLGQRQRAFIDAVGEVALVRAGSALKFCLVAEGKADVYPRFAPCCEWDTAAAHCIVTEAGGTVTDLHGRTVQYNKPDLLSPYFIAAGRRPFPREAALRAVLATL
jgi:3'(2'), 5'-bisphosphate nucleotidase